MNTRLTTVFCLFIVLVMLLSCGPLVEKKKVVGPLTPVSCIAVMPVSTSIDSDDQINYSEARSLQQGAKLANHVLTAELGGHPKVRILTSSQMDTLVPEVSGGITGTVAALGKKLNCDAVLLTEIQRFKQREGTEYAVAEPASAAFSMTLLHAGKGSVLWSADFIETQESFLENILSYDKMQRRGFKWITVEQLLEQGMKERLAKCPYL